MKKVLIVATVQSHIAQFHNSLIKMLKQKGYEVNICAKDNLGEKNGLKFEPVDKVYDVDFSRSPLSLKNIKAYKQLKRIIKENKYDIIHCNTPIGGLLTRIIGKKERKKGTKIYYTAHGFHFYKGAPLKNWVIYYTIEKILSKYTDVLITINKNDYKIAQDKMSAKKVMYIPGVGVDINSIINKKVDKTEKLKELGIPEGKILLLSVGELNQNKNHTIILKAIAQLKNPNLLLLICGNGPLKEKLMEEAKQLNIEKQVQLLGYRRDVSEIMKVSDLFVFPSIREGLGLAAIEAMASGLPIVTSNAGGITDYSKEGITGYLFHPNDANKLAEGINRIINDPEKRELFRKNNVKNSKKYDIKNVLSILERIY